MKAAGVLTRNFFRSKNYPSKSICLLMDQKHRFQNFSQSEEIYLYDRKLYTDQTPLIKKTLDLDYIILPKSMLKRGTM